MSEVDDNRDLLDEAHLLEKRRVELTALAIERRVADLLPRTWSDMITTEMDDPVSITLNTGLTQADAERWTERECRNFLSFIAWQADEKRVQNQLGRMNEEDSI